MENSGLKMKISRLFQSSFASCKSKNISNDAINDKPLFYPQNIRPHYQLIDLFSPKPRPFPSICKPETSQTEQSCKNLLPRTKISDKSSLHDSHNSSNKSQRRTNKKKTKKKKRLARSKIKRFEFYDEFTNICDYKGLFSSDEESEDDDKTTLFSSRSFSSSDSSESFYRRNPRRRRTAAKGVKDSLAVVKRSSDPYSDFRESMLEMIMEKQIFAAKDLEKLLECFLSLNSQHHHGVIIDVFTEICETLFSNLS